MSNINISTQRDNGHEVSASTETERVHTRLKILALCGAKSNNAVTQLQLENLHISDEHYDIYFLHGDIEEEEGDEALAGLVHGPFYSWIDNSDEKTMNKSIVKGVGKVINMVNTFGPFDGVYGFSHGGLIATLAANVADDYKLREAIDKSSISTANRSMRHLARETTIMGSSRALLTRRDSGLGQVRHGSDRRAAFRAQSSNRRASSRFSSLMQFSMRALQPDPIVIEEAPFKFIICACAGLSAMQGLDSITCSVLVGNDTSEKNGWSNLVKTKSLHIIGIEDPMKTNSESLASLFMGAKVMYLPGGHSVGSDTRSDKELHSAIKRVFNRSDVTVSQELVDFRQVNPVTSIAVQPHLQIARVQLKNELLPSGKHGATIIQCLKAQPEDKPFLFNARDTRNIATTYGEVLEFIQGGEGDLRRLGVNVGDVVAYGAPPGGGAAAAMAFLSMGAQTTTAPLAPGMTEPDVLDALDQFHAKHLILFEGVDSPGVEKAFKKYAADGYGILHYAKIIGDDMPGIFQFTSKQVPNFSSTPELSNLPDGDCLLLRTSGTTARPKGVPLKQDTLVNNGAIIAASMQLNDDDVCYSVMPLFHIGGISASVMCTLASGGSICCDGKPFDPSRMVDALAVSNPQPTWYSSVPTIHNATVAFLKEYTKDEPKFVGYGIKNGAWEKGHSLRMIRSGAAALLPPDATALAKAYGGLPIYPSYSMSEQMPITQPPAGKGDTITDKPGSVGVPVAASLAIVGRSHFRPQPYGMEGEIAISGDTVMQSYLENPEADAKNYFLLTMPGDPSDRSPEKSRYFLTGDVGVLDKEGFLVLKGRAKELIKKGGEQVSPYEVEETLLDHPWLKLSVCFSVPSKVYGEEVGCAVVLTDAARGNISEAEARKSFRKWMKDKKFAPLKWPSKWWFGDEEDLPKTKTNKYIRVGLADKLGIGVDEEIEAPISREIKARIDWGVINGFRFVLACYVMFMHIGSNTSWGNFDNLRGWPWHVHCFFTLGGFSMASPMNPSIKKKFSYFLARIGNMYPMYTMALFLGLINLLVVCRPSTFDPEFHWDGQPDDKSRGFFCEGTPATKTSWWGSLILTIISYIFGVAVTPMWPLSWFMGYYLWFSSMYYQCLAIFPATYNYFLTKRKQARFLIKIMLGLQGLNAVILVASWAAMKNGPSYNHYNSETGEAVEDPDEYDNAYGSDPVVYNAVILSFYLFPPFWTIYFIIGGVLAFIYDAYRPAERHNAWIWGYVADVCTLIQIALSITLICQPKYDDPEQTRWFRPSDADYIGDSSTVGRLWDNLAGRIMCPLTTLWIFAMSTGEGYTASILRGKFLVNTLSPASYNCFLFHQMIGQWYFAATRPGEFWNWWQYRKSFYWFSPGPCPVQWYEYFLVITVVVAFSDFMDSTFAPMVKSIAKQAIRLFVNDEGEEEVDVAGTLCSLVEKMTGIEPEIDSTLDEVGLASVGIPVIVGMLNSAFSTKNNPLSVTSADLMKAKTIHDIAIIVELAWADVEGDGV